MGTTQSLRNWLDHRTGFRRLVEVLLIEHIPGGAKWRYVWGSCLAFVFGVQLITGVLLMTAYSPGDSTAWSSVYFIQYEMDFGWLIRGLHHFGSQAMVVLLGVHMLQVVIAGAHLPPREVNWWLGLALLSCVLGLSLTGYLLPWDQKGFWATRVATNIAGNIPVVGSFIQKVVVGGPEYGHHTLTRFYTLHVGILPPLIILLTVLHLTVFRRHGVTAPANAKGEGWFWPDQAFRDMVVSMIVFAVMLALVLYGEGHKIEPSDATSASESGFYGRIAHAGRDGKGVNLDAPADPSQDYPARPEWYFLSLFQLLKYFEGSTGELIGSVIIPNAVGVLLFLLPLFAFGKRQGTVRQIAHALSVIVIFALVAAIGILTFLALRQDRNNKKFQDQVANAEQAAGRAIQLAGQGIPAEGAGLLLRRDPLTQGKELFRQNCASCHSHGDDFEGNFTASDLKGWGTPGWIRGLLDKPDDPHYFGRTKLTAMTRWVKSERRGAKDESDKKALEEEFDRIANWLGGHPRKDVPTDNDVSEFAQGFRAFEARCNSCHTYKGAGGTADKAPDFTGYGNASWLRVMLVAPAHDLRYGKKNRMPAFRDLEGPNAELIDVELRDIKNGLLKEIADDDPKAAEKRQEIDAATRMLQLSDIDRELVIRWLVGDFRVVFGGEPITAPPARE